MTAREAFVSLRTPQIRHDGGEVSAARGTTVATPIQTSFRPRAVYKKVYDRVAQCKTDSTGFNLRA